LDDWTILAMRRSSTAFICAWLAASASVVYADPLACGLDGYKAQPGLGATQSADTLTVQWAGEAGQELRMQFGVAQGTPTIQDLSARRSGAAAWTSLATNAAPDYRVTGGLRRMSNQQMAPLRGLGVELTDEIVDRYRWDPFWDAPLDLSPAANRSSNPPPAAGVANQPGLPRRPEEISRSAAVFHVARCTVVTDGRRLTVSFPGVQLGAFSGALEYTFFKGTNLVRQEIVASTSVPWVAYKYHAGLKGLRTSGARVVWKDIANNWQEYRFGGAVNDDDVPLKASNRIVVAESRGGAIAIFPPPHNFFWAREIAINLGYDFYRKDSDSTFSVGVRQADHEDESENQANFALYSARPGTAQRMTVFLYPMAGNADAAFERAASFTHNDRYKPLPGYQVMNHHYHMDLGRRLGEAGSLDADIPDLVALKALGINIVSQIDSVGLGSENPPVGATYPGGQPVPPRAEGAPPAQTASGRPPVDELQIRYNSIEGAKRHSDTGYLVLPSQEYFGSPLGGHTDLLFPHAVYWDVGRRAGQPLTDSDPKYGMVYHVGGADDLMEMARREEMLITMPHPRTKGSTGFPDSIRELPYFNDPHYQGVGFRWGMGLDRSEQRLCEYRCLPLLDDMSNWLADATIPLKYLLSISEVRHQQPGDDIYASSPVSYVRLDPLPAPDDVSPLITKLMQGDYFVTSGEVLIPSYAVKGSGSTRTIEADVEWTFPLQIVEVVWGDGSRTDRQLVPVADLPASGSHHFSIPVDAGGKKWVRFAAWDVAGNGALVQPVRLSTPNPAR
jgi:hypothetical protein